MTASRCRSARSPRRCRCWKALAWFAIICFLDPPYRMRGSYEQALGYLAQSRMLQPSSVVIAEHEKKFDPGERFGALVRYRRLDQGDASLSFYKLG